MGNLYWLTDAQMERLKPFFPKSHGKPRVDGRPVLGGTRENGGAKVCHGSGGMSLLGAA